MKLSYHALNRNSQGNLLTHQRFTWSSPGWNVDYGWNLISRVCRQRGKQERA